MPAILERIRVDRVLNAVAAGTTDQNGGTIDLSADNGYRGCLFMVAFGTLTATQVTSIKAQESADDSTWTDLAGTKSIELADTDGNKVLLLDVYRPNKRYIRVVVDRGTANAVIDGAWALLYENNLEGTAQSTDVAGSEVHISPAAGTA